MFTIFIYTPLSKFNIFGVLWVTILPHKMKTLSIKMFCSIQCLARHLFPLHVKEIKKATKAIKKGKTLRIRERDKAPLIFSTDLCFFLLSSFFFPLFPFLVMFVLDLDQKNPRLDPKGCLNRISSLFTDLYSFSLWFLCLL